MIPPDEPSAAGAESGALSFRDRRFGPAFEKRETVIPVGGRRPYDPGEWDDAIVVVEEGAVDVGCVDGSRHRFARGDVICLSRMLLNALHNDGDVPVLLIAVSRRRDDPAPPDPGRDEPASSAVPGERSPEVGDRLAGGPTDELPGPDRL